MERMRMVHRRRVPERAGCPGGREPGVPCTNVYGEVMRNCEKGWQQGAGQTIPAAPDASQQQQPASPPSAAAAAAAPGVSSSTSLGCYLSRRSREQPISSIIFTISTNPTMQRVVFNHGCCLSLMMMMMMMMLGCSSVPELSERARERDSERF